MAKERYAGRGGLRKKQAILLKDLVEEDAAMISARAFAFGMLAYRVSPGCKRHRPRSGGVVFH